MSRLLVVMTTFDVPIAIVIILVSFVHAQIITTPISTQNMYQPLLHGLGVRFSSFDMIIY